MVIQTDLKDENVACDSWEWFYYDFIVLLVLSYCVSSDSAV